MLTITRRSATALLGSSLAFHQMLFAAGTKDGSQFKVTDPQRKLYRDYVDRIATTLVAHSERTPAGLTWRNIKEDGSSEEETGFYDGTPGVAYFLLKAHSLTRNPAYAEAGQAALSHLMSLAKQDQNGLYYDVDINGLFEGNAGRAYVALYAWKVSGDERYLNFARQVAARMLSHPDVGAQGSCDLISGAAGTGLFLLQMHRATGDRRYLRGALTLGDYLEKTAEQVPGTGVRWRLYWRDSGHTGCYPGFSHGGAGIVYFLDRLADVSRVKKYRMLADQGEQYLKNIAVIEGDGAKWYTDEATLKSDFRIQWCHGAVGMTPMFLERYWASRDPSELAWAGRSTAYLLKVGIASKNNASVCHGASGNALSVAQLYQRTGNPALRPQIDAGIQWLVDNAIPDGREIWWKSKSYQRNFGYMTGIAGVGDFFVNMASNGRMNMMSGLGYSDEL